MTEETENPVLSTLRDIKVELTETKTGQGVMKEDTDTRFDQGANFLTVVVGAQADPTYRVQA